MDLNASCGNKDVQFVVREAIYDGYGLYLAVDVIPQRDDVLLLEWSMSNASLRPESAAALLGEDQPEDVTVSAYCEAKGLRMLESYVSLRLPEGSSESNSVSINRAVRNPDGSMTTVMNALFRGDPETLCIQCTSYEYVQEGTTPVWFEDLPLHLQMADSAVQAEKTAAAAMMVDEATGLRLDEVHAVRTPIGCYVDAVWSTNADAPEMVGARDFGGYGADAQLFTCVLLRMDDTDIQYWTVDTFLTTEQRNDRRVHHTVWKMDPGNALPEKLVIAFDRHFWVEYDRIASERIGACTVDLR